MSTVKNFVLTNLTLSEMQRTTLQDLLDFFIRTYGNPPANGNPVSEYTLLEHLARLEAIERNTTNFFNSNLPFTFRSTTVDEVVEQIGESSEFNLYGFNIINPNAVDVFVKIYDSNVAPTVGTTVPKKTFQVPANGSIVIFGKDVIYPFLTKGWIAATTGYLDNSIAAPALDLIVDINYK